MQIRAALLASFALNASLSAAQPTPWPENLTPVGAEVAGNADGTIPKWDGGLNQSPDGYRSGDHYPDPYAGDAPLFTIGAGDADTYKERLSPGQLAMFKAYPTWKMRVYPARRSAAYPEKVYRETVANEGLARLTANGNGLLGVTGGVPFPRPTNGLQVMWNHLVRYRGDTLGMEWDQVTLLKGDQPYIASRDNEFVFGYGNLAAAKREDDILFYFWQKTTAPAKINGNILLLHEHLATEDKEGRSAWAYFKALAKIRRAPNVGHDSPDMESGGLRVNDELLMFNGATDRFEWKLVGKREMYVPYNAFKLAAARKGYGEILRLSHLNPDLLRYELHRTWVVDATLKSGASHIYGRRTFYLDEDSWSVLAIDKYDKGGNLFRYAEMHPVMFSEIPMPFAAAEVHHDLAKGYIVSGLQTDKAAVYKRLKRSAADFQPDMPSMVR